MAGLRGVFSRMSPERAEAAGRRLGLLYRRVDGRRRELARANIARAFPEQVAGGGRRALPRRLRALRRARDGAPARVRPPGRRGRRPRRVPRRPRRARGAPLGPRRPLPHRPSRQLGVLRARDGRERPDGVRRRPPARQPSPRRAPHRACARATGTRSSRSTTPRAACSARFGAAASSASSRTSTWARPTGSPSPSSGGRPRRPRPSPGSSTAPKRSSCPPPRSASPRRATASIVERVLDVRSLPARGARASPR